MALKPAVFIDKDGTLIENVPFNVNPERIRLVDGAEKALLRLKRFGYEIFVISNQSGVGLGKFGASELIPVENKISSLLEGSSVRIRKYYWCVHAPDAHCTCRKPRPGLFFRAALEFGIDLKNSWMMGDILHDVEAGHRAGCRSILVENGNETEWDLSNPIRVPEFMTPDLESAVCEILRETA
jgi:histidinol-phosphate phosphatase family protein